MIGAGFAIIGLSAFGLWLARRRKLVTSRRYAMVMVPAIALPFVANSAGWIFTEMGRQPWVVQGLLKTSDAVSPSVSTAEVAISMVGFTVVYGVLAAVAVRLLLRIVRNGSPPPAGSEPETPAKPDLALVY